MDELYSLLVPLSNTRLILPRSCVAEVVSFTPDFDVADGALTFDYAPSSEGSARVAVEETAQDDGAADEPD